MSSRGQTNTVTNQRGGIRQVTGFSFPNSKAVFRSREREGELGLPPDAPVLEWGGPSNFAHSEGAGFEIKQSNDLREQGRQVEVKRITNPEDSEQYVDVEVIKSLTLLDGENKRHSWSFKN